MNSMLGGSSLIDRNLNLHVVFHIFLQQKHRKKNRVKTVSFTRVFVPLMVLEILKPTKSKTQVSMAHVPTTKSRTQHLNRRNRQVFACFWDVFWVSFGLLDGYNTGGQQPSRWKSKFAFCFHHLLAKKWKYPCETFFLHVFFCSWFCKFPSLQNRKHRCRWPMSLLQNQEHSI